MPLSASPLSAYIPSIPLMVASLGDLAWGPVVGGYVAALCLSAAYLAIGLCVSARTDNQVVALMVTLAVGSALYLVGSDAITGLLKLREEMMVMGRYTIQAFQNIGGNGFPFAPFQGATIPYGCIGPDAKCLMGDTFAFVGGGKDEPLGVFVGGQGQATRISTREIEGLIAAHPTPSTIQVEQRVFPGERFLIVHLDAVSLCLAITASQAAEDGAWTLLQSGRFAAYRPRNAVLCYGAHHVGDLGSAAVGTLTRMTPDHFGDKADWQSDAGLLFNNGMGALLSEVELHGLFPVTESAIFFSVTFDGRQWSNEVARLIRGTLGERVLWRPGLRVPRLVGMRWRGSQRVSIARAEVQAEALSA